MNFMCQAEALSRLTEMAQHSTHSILIEGVIGSGKTYLARQYAGLLGVPDFQILEPTVAALRGAVDACNNLQNPLVLCVENLDLGVPAAAYTLLKFLEEPNSNVYIVVTCRNMKRVPDTIISRSVQVTTSPPRREDVDLFAENRKQERFNELKNTTLWKCATSFRHATTILDMTDEQVSFYPALPDIMAKQDTVANMVWKLGHYADNSDTPIDIVINYLIAATNDAHLKMAGIACMKDISSGRIAAHAVLAKFAFECKYCK